MEQLICMVLAILGVACHTLLKANGLKSDAKVANLEFSFKEYLLNDWISITLSILAGIAWVFLFDEAARNYPDIQNWLRGSFFVVGLSGSYLIQRLSNKTKKAINKAVDVKTDIADNK